MSITLSGVDWVVGIIVLTGSIGLGLFLAYRAKAGATDIVQVRRGAMFATLLKLSPVFIFALPGVIGYALYPGLERDASRQTFVLLLNNLLPAGIRGLVLASLAGITILIYIWLK